MYGNQPSLVHVIYAGPTMRGQPHLYSKICVGLTEQFAAPDKPSGKAVQDIGNP